MSTLAAKYTRLKKQIGGNREKTHYEETFGMPVEEFYRITMPNARIRRILAEIEFSIRLSRELHGKYDADVEAALDLLLQKIAEDGVLTGSACMEGEKLLLPLQKEAKAYELILAAHAHIDMNWMWGWEETVAAVVSTFQTMLDLMDEYPDFHFSQSQASVYEIIEKYAPELKPRMEARIREGRWEVTASAWVETDKNMPSAESLLNHVRYTRDYLQKHWGIDPDSLDLDFSPDTFGHSANLPELDSFAGIRYYYHCRGLDGGNALYRWKAPSGKELLVYREQYWYNSGVTPLPAIGLIDVSRRSGGLKTGLMVYGVGDHGGGPTRRDVERALEMQEWPVFPRIRFGTFHDYFRAAESVRDKLPVVEKELNYFAPGCYTTQSRLKMGNRHAEAALFDAQAVNALASGAAGAPYLSAQYEDAWQSVLFTHFHDILTGSCVRESREHAMGLFAHAMAVAETRASFAMQAVCRAVDTSGIRADEAGDSQSEGAGAGYGLNGFSGVPAPERGRGLTRIFHLFSTFSLPRKRCCEITVWDWTGDMREIAVAAPDGTPLPFALIDDSLQQYWDHKYFRILVEAELPAFGYATVVLSEKEPEEYRVYLQPERRTAHPDENIVLENDLLRAEFSCRSGALLSLFDKAGGGEWLRPGQTGGLRLISTEYQSSNAWNIGRYSSVDDPFRTVSLKPVSGSPLRQGFEMEQRVGDSRITATVSLTKDSPAVSVQIEADWRETAREKESVPVLAYLLPVKDAESFLYDVPGGAVSRKGMEMDVPGLQYGAAVRGGRAAYLSSDCKYGYRGCGEGLLSTLINSTYSPDPYPEFGVHKILLHIGVASERPKDLEETAFLLNHPARYQTGTVHPGTLPTAASLLGTDCGTAVISGITEEDGALCVKLYETEGKDSAVSFTFAREVRSAVLTDLKGSVLRRLPSEKKSVSFSVGAYSMAMLRVSL
jgi:alpha-mannosidase